MEYFTTNLGFGFEVKPEMFEDWTGWTREMIAKDFVDVLTEYAEHHPGIAWVDFGSNRDAPENIRYYLMAIDSIRYSDEFAPTPIDLPKGSYEKILRESVHKLNIKKSPGWVLGAYRW